MAAKSMPQSRRPFLRICFSAFPHVYLQTDMNTREPETVIALTSRIKNTLESSFSGVWVEGELSNFKLMSSGHAYFVLKDSAAQISCAFFSMAKRMPSFEVKDGVKVRLMGDVSVYEPRGSYQLIVRSIEQAGLGDLMIRFEELKRRLKEEGLFDGAHKRPLPLMPRKIGIVTSPTGAAIRDMLNVTQRRFANIHIVIAPARVQGTEAVAVIVAGINLLNSLSEPPDVIIVGRGGGSIEDLWCFNEEAVVRAIYHSRVPVISAVGHETDFTLSDFAADLRAPTPSAAAELVVGRKEDFENTLATHAKRLAYAMRSGLEKARARIDVAAGSHVFRQPESALRHHAQRLDMLSQRIDSILNASLAEDRRRLDNAAPRLTRATERTLQTTRLRIHSAESRSAHAAQNARAEAGHRLGTLAARLDSINPMAVLSRGYAIVKSASGSVIKSAAQVATGDFITTQLRDGELSSVVTDGGPTHHRRQPKNHGLESEQPSLF